MTTVLAKLTRSGGGYLQLDAVAPGPSGGMYAAGPDAASTVCVARLNSDGTLNWAKDISVPSLTEAVVSMSSSSNRLVIAVNAGNGQFGTSCIVMLDDTGALVWESVLSNFGTGFTEGLLIGSDNSVYVIGVYNGPLSGFQDDYALLKLNPTTGAITWQVGLSETSTTDSGTASPAQQQFGAAVQLSGGDLVLSLWGPGSSSNDHGHLQRVSSSDGSVVWTRKITWIGSNQSYFRIGADSSDNIYCVGPKVTDTGKGWELPVLKLDSSGTLLWSRNVRQPAFAFTPVWDPTWGVLACDSSGVQVFGNPIAGKHGHALIPQAGTVSAGTVPLSYYTPENYYFNQVRGGLVGSSALFGWYDSDPSNTDYHFVVGISPTGSGDDGTYGAIVRATTNFDLVAGTATVSTPGSWTRPAAPTMTLASDLGASVGTGTLSSSVTPPARTCAATSLGPTTQFGPDAYLRGYTTHVGPSTAFGSNIIISRQFPNVGITPPSTTFGTAVGSRQQRPTALGPTASFGTPAYQPNTTRAADTLGVVLAGIGVPFATLGIAPQPPGYASSVDPATTFGTPAAHQGISVAASGTLVTQFGTASARYTLAATALEPGAQFGTATVTMARAASGFRVTQLGTPAVGLYGLPAGFLRTQFGTPAARMPVTCAATGFLVTNMGSGAAGGAWNLRTRSAYFRTRFGTPQAERTAP